MKGLARLLLLPAILPLLGAGAEPDFRLHRPLEAAAGWNELTLPFDVIDGTRVDGGDLRIVRPGGGEVGFTTSDLGRDVGAHLSFTELQKVEGKETIALLDRGEHPEPIESVRLEVAPLECVKNVVLEASPDRNAWREIAQRTIFSTYGPRYTEVSFAPTDQRYFRFRFDDRHSAPVVPTAVWTSTLAPKREHPRVRLESRLQVDRESEVATWSVVLPFRHLPIDEVSFQVSDVVFSRHVRVYERVWFRDEMSRRLLGDGVIERTASGRETMAVRTAQPTSRSLEIEIDKSGREALGVTDVFMAVAPRSILFRADASETLELRYGSSTIPSPKYDLGDVVRQGWPSHPAIAKLGPVTDHGAETLPPPPVTRGASIGDKNAWQMHQSITLPAHGNNAYLDLTRGSDAPLSDVRVIDQHDVQVPYLVEAQPRHGLLAVAWTAAHQDRTTTILVSLLTKGNAVDRLELEVPSPDYFSRQVTVTEETSDERGPTGERVLATTTLARAPGDTLSPLPIEIARPTRAKLTVRIDDGDNAPLAVSHVSAEITRRRLNFLFLPDDHLTLLAVNPHAGAPSYDLALIASQVLAAPAEAATLGAVLRQESAAPKPTPRWFWLFVLGASALLLMTLRRVLTDATRKK